MAHFGDFNLEGVLFGSNLQIVLYDWCEPAELQLAVRLVKFARILRQVIPVVFVQITRI